MKLIIMYRTALAISKLKIDKKDMEKTKHYNDMILMFNDGEQIVCYDETKSYAIINFNQ